MKPEEQNITIAEACGWIKGQWPLDASCKKVWIFPEHIPNYYGDLNACHEMEKVLHSNLQMWWDYCSELSRIVPATLGNESHVHATAPQRCEAFLRTLNLWKPSTKKDGGERV